MNTNLLLAGFFWLPMLLCFAYTSALAGQSGNGPDTPTPEANALAECHSIGQEIAVRESGVLYKAEATGSENQDDCVIVVVIPGGEGERPRRAEFLVPR